MRHKVLGPFCALLALLVAAVAAAPGTPAAAQEATSRGGPGRDLRPVIFVHGGAGSGAQFRTQALRLTSNGYLAELIAVVEYDSTFATTTMEEVHTRLDERIAELQAASGADQVDLIGHSLGTAVSQAYLGAPERAANVAHYVNVDGMPADAPPGGVDTLAVWGEGNDASEVTGAQNHHAPDQSHVQVATSAETFAVLYEFLTGHRPWTTDVIPEPPGRVRISGEANEFPSNQGAEDTTLEIWAVDGDTGQRRGDRPAATFEIDADGAWGPFRAHGRHHYELALVGEDSTHHFYFEPFVRSDHLVRLLTSGPGSALDELRETGPGHSTFTVTRYKEWWGDQGDQSDVLSIDGQNVLNAATAPRSKRVNAVFAFDAGVDEVTDLSAPIPDFFALPFMTGVDVFAPATTPADGTVEVAMTPRGGDGEPAVVNVPNWPSDRHHVSIGFRDFEQADESWPWFPWNPWHH